MAARWELCENINQLMKKIAAKFFTGRKLITRVTLFWYNYCKLIDKNSYNEKYVLITSIILSAK